MSTIKDFGERGGKLITGAETDKGYYLIHVTEAATFTVLNEKNTENDTASDVMNDMGLTGETVAAGTFITPSRNFFSDVTITSGQAWGYNIK